MTSVVNVFYGVADGWVGIKINTTSDDDDVEVLVDNTSSCCEEWGVDLNGIRITSGEDDLNGASDQDDCKSLVDELLQSKIHNVRWNIRRQKSREQTGDSYQDYRYYACVDVEYELPDNARKTLEIDAWCFHNGFYPHTVKTKWREHEDSQEL